MLKQKVIKMVRHKAICPDCKGNGFVYINVPSYNEVKQCTTCKSQGEIDVKEPTIEELEQAVKLQ